MKFRGIFIFKLSIFYEVFIHSEKYREISPEALTLAG